MFHKIVFFLILNIFFFKVFSQNILFNEDFENVNINDWKILNLDSNILDSSMSKYDTSAWILRIDNEDITDTVISSSSYFTVQNPANRWLISPEILLGSSGNVISWNAKSLDPSFPDSYLVLISNGGLEPNDFVDTVSIQLLENYIWTNHQFSLSTLGYNNQTIRIAFVLNSVDGYELFIDDFEIRENDPLSIENVFESQKKSIYFYDNYLITNQLATELNIKDISGKNVYNTKLPFNKISLDFLNESCYFVDVKIDDNFYHLKYIK